MDFGSTDAAYFVAILTFNLVAGSIAFACARYSHANCRINLRRCALVYVVGWLVGSTCVFFAHRLLGLAGIDMPDAFTILLSLAVLFWLMDRLLDWLTESDSVVPPSWRNRFRHS
jgi:hypothetical protein